MNCTVAVSMLVSLDHMLSSMTSRRSMVDSRDRVSLAGNCCLGQVGCSRGCIHSNIATMSRVYLSSVGRATVPQMRRDVYPCCTVRGPGHVVVLSLLLLLAARQILAQRLLFLGRVVDVGWRWASRFGRFDGTSAVSGSLTTCVSARLLA
jgi:hypothetical protein